MVAIPYTDNINEIANKIFFTYKILKHTLNRIFILILHRVIKNQLQQWIFSLEYKYITNIFHSQLQYTNTFNNLAWKTDKPKIPSSNLK